MEKIMSNISNIEKIADGVSWGSVVVGGSLIIIGSAFSIVSHELIQKLILPGAFLLVPGLIAVSLKNIDKLNKREEDKKTQEVFNKTNITDNEL
jgi:hypothetical protein